MITTEKSGQLSTQKIVKRHSKKLFTLIALIPLFLIAGQKIVTAGRSIPIVNTKIEQAESKITTIRKARRHVIRTAVYNQFATRR